MEIDMPNSIDAPLPIQVSASSAQAAITAGLRILITLVTGFGLLLHLVAKGDLQGVYAFFATNDGYALIAGVIAAITFGSSLYLTVLKHRKLVVVADAAPNSVAKVTS
jgi:hypothetical protein